MVSEVKEKNWFAKHWVVTIFLGLILIGMIGTIFDSGDTNSTIGNSINSDNTKTETKQYVEEDLYTLIAYYVSSSSPYTEMQKEENFKQYKGKWIKTTGIVKEVDDVMFSDTPVVRLVNPDNQYLTGATIYFEDFERDKLVEVDKYSEITFEGRIEDYGGFMGIIIKDATLI